MSISIIRPKPQGFQLDDAPTSAELSPVVPGSTKQQFLFDDAAKKGFHVSEVFMRFEGMTPWKRIGEVASKTADFEEAVRAQWPLLVEHSYYLSRKARFWLATEHPIQLGYTNETAHIVLVRAGPLPEGTPPLDLRRMLQRCGFRGALKPRIWRHMHTNAKDLYESKKDFHRRKPHLMHRERNARLISHKWYDPNKYKGRYTWFMKKKRGLVVGVNR